MNFSGISKANRLGQVLRWPLRLLPAWARIPIMQGPLRGCWWIVGSGNHGYWLGSYEQTKARRFVQAIHQGAVVYDVGANVGYYTLLAAVAVGRNAHVIAQRG